MIDSNIKILKSGGVGVLLTDTLYGVVGRALDKKVVKRIYQLKVRNDKKPLIILVSSISDLKLFGITINKESKEALKKIWPGPVSVILPCPFKKFEYLHRGTKSLAFRFPRKKSLVNIIRKTGPLVAPSANPEGLNPAQNITKALDYFGKGVDFYMRGGAPKNKPSRIIRIGENGVEIIRK